MAQDVPRDEWPPELTEVWEPEPVQITPGAAYGDAPSDAIILFDGTSLDAWEHAYDPDSPAAWRINADGSMTVVPGAGDIDSRQTFGDVQLHVEWMTPLEVQGPGQNSGNSGVFLQERYEVQVLNSYDNRTYSNGQAGSIYKEHIPMVNASRPRGEWQSYDIVYEAPHFDDSGSVVKPPFITVMHNGVVVQHRVEVLGTTEYRGIHVLAAHGDAGIRLQDHGNAVSYRNIWVREL